MEADQRIWFLSQAADRPLQLSASSDVPPRPPRWEGWPHWLPVRTVVLEGDILEPCLWLRPEYHSCQDLFLQREGIMSKTSVAQNIYFMTILRRRVLVTVANVAPPRDQASGTHYFICSPQLSIVGAVETEAEGQLNHVCKGTWLAGGGSWCSTRVATSCSLFAGCLACFPSSSRALVWSQKEHLAPSTGHF